MLDPGRCGIIASDFLSIIKAMESIVSNACIDSFPYFAEMHGLPPSLADYVLGDSEEDRGISKFADPKFIENVRVGFVAYKEHLRKVNELIGNTEIMSRRGLISKFIKETGLNLFVVCRAADSIKPNSVNNVELFSYQELLQAFKKIVTNGAKSSEICLLKLTALA
ncbi:MAG: hypothetical protein EOP48_06735 [Sphingobacteriales bacterium]|nr:MAG: hypothetical protein EOP48_06735 [Sphingobacteriales bacterium]